MGARIELLGRLRLTLDGAERPLPPGRKSRALLGYLAVHRDTELPRARLAGLFWGDAEEARARQSLRQALSEVRRCLDGLAGHAWLDASELAVALRGPVSVDAIDFLRDTAAVAASPLAGRHSAEELAALERAVTAESVDLLPECYDDWCVELRGALEARRLRALEALLAAAGSDGGRVRTIGARLLAVDPLREDVHRRVMEAAARAGDRAAALRQFGECVAALERELGAAPSDETVQLYERIRDGLLGPAAGGEAALVGRERELEALLAHLAAAQAGGRVVLLSGPAGIGKSRLLAELAATAQLRGWRTVAAGGDAGDHAGAYAVWSAALRSLLIAEPDLVAAVPRALLPALALLIPEARHLVASGGAAPGRAELFAGVFAILRAAAVRQPLLLVLDDLHWADADSALLFAQVCRAVRELPVLLLGAMRDDELARETPIARTAAALREQRLLHDLAVPPLDAEGIRALLAGLSGNEEVARSLGGFTYAETEGNPLHAGELWRAMQEQGRLERDRAGRWHWRGRGAGGRERLPLPHRVRATIAGRLLARSARARELLTLGAVLGRPWSLDLVAAVTETEPDGWQAAQEELIDARLVRGGEHGYRFAHEMIRDAVERETDAATQRSLHLRAGTALAALAEREPETAPERAEELARHFVLAGPRGVGRAYFWTREAARRSLRSFAHERAAEQLQLAIDYAEGGLVSDAAELAALYLDLAEALARSGRMSEARSAADRALAGVAAGGDRDALTAAAARLAGLFDANRFPDLVIAYTDTALALPEIEPTPAYPLLVQQRAYAQERRGDAAALLAAAETLAELARRSGDRRSELEGLRCTALFLSNYSLDLERCAALRLELSEAYAALGEPFLAIELLADAADALLRMGELRRARPHAEASVAEAHRLQGAAAAFATCPVLMEIYLTTGEFAALDALFAELAPYLVDAPTGRAIQFFGAKGVADMWRGLPRNDVAEVGTHGDDLVWREMRIVGQIWAAMQAGAFAEARALLDQMAPLVPPLGEGMRWFVAALPLVYNYNEIGCGKEAAVWCEGLLRHPTFQIPGGQGRLEAARTLRLNGDPGTARRLLDEAVAHYEREGMRPFLAQARLEQGRLALACGDEPLAERYIEQAAAAFATLGMVPWLARTRALQRAGGAAL